MKKSIFLAVAAVAMTACSNDVDLGMKDANKQTADNAIGFEVRNSNMSRASQELQKTGHYNFGVFGYKKAASNPAIMVNYLVGYMDDTNKKGYFMTTTNQTTNGDAQGTDPGKSMWSYEKLGYEDYTYTRSEGYYYYTKDDTEYMSNFKNQFLRYWDHSTDWTKFYAYAPYIKGSENTSGEDPLTKDVVTFDNDTHEMTFPDGTIKAGYDDPSKFEYLCAYKKVLKEDYDKDVQLTFKHMNSQIRIVFYEVIEGYDVQMLDLKSGASVGVLAVPTTKSGESYTYCTNGIPKTASTVVAFQETTPYITLGSMTATKYYTGAAGNAIDGSSINDKALVFERPTADALKDNKTDAISDTEGSWSKTVYYGIPHDTSCGLTFRVSFKLTSTTGETINVYNAGVHVDAANCKWEAGKRYTYVFKITKNATGSTGTDNPTVDPNPGTGALFPIVFDGITVEDWEIATGNAEGNDHNIN